jgi:glycosyltransferase involved in cell wall biosynthesis
VPEATVGPDNACQDEPLESPQVRHVPRLTVVTPSFNQARYLESTLRSVLDQGYPNLEYIVIDGGSTDGSAEILRKYAGRLAYWVSERDGGQADAINKGMARATGELRAYLNSDDIYLPGALEHVAKAYAEHPEADLFHGDCRVIDEEGKPIGRRRPRITRFEEIVDLWGVWWQERNFVQPEVFWTRRIAERIGPFQTDLFMVMDYEYWTRVLRAGGQVVALAEELAAFRMTSTQKSTQRERSAREILDVVERLLWDMDAPIRWSKRLRLQGQWLYQERFLTQVAASMLRDEPRWQRLLRGLGVAARHPKVLLATEYRRRLIGAAGRAGGRCG